MIGIEGLLKSVLENYLREHPELVAQGAQISQFVLGLNERLANIEASLVRLEQRLTEKSHVGTELAGTLSLPHSGSQMGEDGTGRSVE